MSLKTLRFVFGHGVTHARITPDTTRIVPSGLMMFLWCVSCRFEEVRCAGVVRVVLNTHPGYGVYIIYGQTDNVQTDRTCRQVP